MSHYFMDPQLPQQRRQVGVKLLGRKADEAARRWDRREIDQSMDVEIEQIFKGGKLGVRHGPW